MAYRRFHVLMIAALLAPSQAPAPPERQVAPQAPATVAELLASYVDWVEGRRPGMQMMVVDLDAARTELGRIAPIFLTPLEGTVESFAGTCPSLTFTVAGTPISTSAATMFDGGSCAVLGNSASVKVLRRLPHGQNWGLATDAALPAQRVTVLTPGGPSPGAAVPAARAPAKPHVYDESRRRLLATFALELAAAGSNRQAAAAARLVEWACPYVRSHVPLGDFDRAWQLAALAVIEGGINARAIGLHLDHATPIFAGEPRLLLAEGIAEEATAAPNEVITIMASGRSTAALQQRSQMEGERLRAAERAIARFREAMKHEAVRGEAALRLGHVQLTLRKYEDALASWADAEAAGTNDLAVVYLLHLFRGIAYEGMARASGAFATTRSDGTSPPDGARPDGTPETPAADAGHSPRSRAALERARDSYLKALEISPGAHSATIRLAALTFRTGRRDQPDRLLERLFTDDDPRRDPWWSYYAADWRFWYPRIERVRALLGT